VFQEILLRGILKHKKLNSLFALLTALYPTLCRLQRPQRMQYKNLTLYTLSIA
jgi:hypothetical protein